LLSKKSTRTGLPLGESLLEAEDSGAGEGEGAGLSEPEFEDAVSAMSDHATLPRQYWSCPGAAGFHVRGQHYLRVGTLFLAVVRARF